MTFVQNRDPDNQDVCLTPLNDRYIYLYSYTSKPHHNVIQGIGPSKPVICTTKSPQKYDSRHPDKLLCGWQLHCPGLRDPVPVALFDVTVTTQVHSSPQLGLQIMAAFYKEHVSG